MMKIISIKDNIFLERLKPRFLKYKKEIIDIADNMGFDNTALFILSFLFLIFYTLFLIFYDVIHNSGNVDTSNITPWMTSWTLENDGFELYVMTVAMPTYLLLCYISIRFINLKVKWLSSRKYLIAYLLIMLIILCFNTIYKTSSFYVLFGLFTILIVILCSYFSFYYLNIRPNKTTRSTIKAMIFLLLFLVCLLTSANPIIFDYSFFIGPANKILQGEKLGSFYIQYNLIGTYLFALMQKLDIKIHEMHLILICILVFWIYLYCKVAKLLFNNQIIIYLFILTLILVRYLSVTGGPVAHPQVGPLRLDLWVPLLIVFVYFGLNSIVSSVSFSIGYLADDIFGLMYLCLYLFILIIDKIINKKNDLFKFRDFTLFLFPLLAFILHYFIFNSFGSIAGKLYSDYHIGFLPISISSSFWILAWILPVCLYMLLQKEKNILLIVFIFGISCIQLTYFFGRSHDHNLINISGIFILILFLTIDKLFSSQPDKKIFLAFVVVLISGIAINFNSNLRHKASFVISNIKSPSIIDPRPIENIIEHQKKYLKSLNYSKINIISDVDPYINYRLGFNQIGYFSPFYANIRIDSLIDSLESITKNKYHIILYSYHGGDNLKNQLSSLNDNNFLLKKGIRIDFTNLEYGLSELKINSKK